jgi:hypothetical protein
MNQRAFLTAPPRMNFATIARISLGLSPNGSSPASVAQQHAVRQAHSRPLATRERAGGAPSER